MGSTNPTTRSRTGVPWAGSGSRSPVISAGPNRRTSSTTWPTRQPAVSASTRLMVISSGWSAAAWRPCTTRNWFSGSPSSAMGTNPSAWPDSRPVSKPPSGVIRAMKKAATLVAAVTSGSWLTASAYALAAAPPGLRRVPGDLRVGGSGPADRPRERRRRPAGVGDRREGEAGGQPGHQRQHGPRAPSPTQPGQVPIANRHAHGEIIA